MPSLIATLGANISPFTRGLQDAKGQAQGAGGEIASALGNKLSGALAGIVSVGAIEQAIQHTVEYGSKVNDLALRLGISTDAVQQWDYALRQNGSSIDAAVGFFEKLAVSRDKALRGNPELIENYRKLGISVQQLSGMRTEDIGAAIAKAYEVGDPQALIESLRAVGGRAAGEMAVAFRDGLGDLLKDAPLISPDDIAALDRAGDAWARLKAESQSDIASPVAMLTEMALGIIDFARLALAIPVGALNGVVEGLQKAYASGGIFAAVGHLLDFGKGGSAAEAFGGAAEAVDAVSVQQGQRDRDAAERKARLARGGALGEGEDAKAKAEADKALKIALDETAKAEKEAAREKERAAKRAEQIDEEEAKRERNRKDEMPFKSREHINSLSSSGAFWGALQSGPQLAMLNTQKQSEKHLQGIYELVKANRMSLYEKAGNMGAGVEF